MQEWSGKTSAYAHKHGDFRDNPVPQNTPNGVRKITVLDAQWTTCPIEVYNEVSDLWRAQELGNDRYIYKTSIEGLEELGSEDYPYMVKHWYWGETQEEQRGWVEEPGSVALIIKYLREQGVTENENVWIHFWW